MPARQVDRQKVYQAIKDRKTKTGKLNEAFEHAARQYKLTPATVRQYYYKEAKRDPEATIRPYRRSYEKFSTDQKMTRKVQSQDDVQAITQIVTVAMKAISEITSRSVANAA